MSRLNFEDLTPEDIEPLPDFDADARRADLDEGCPRRRFVHVPVTHDQMASTIQRALSDAEAAGLAAASVAHQRGDIPQREVAPGSGVFTLTRGRMG